MPHLFEVVDSAGDMWLVPHLTCGGNSMVPGNNPDVLFNPPWWWYCLTCHRFVRPLSADESEVLLAAIKDADKKSTKRRRNKR